ncbi:MAG: Minf_1886 family protein [Planctomycetota bacterium]|jgi:uncharacterized repeat protein (TIGR04138 family)
MTQHQEAVDWKRILSEVPYPIEAFAFVREGLSYAVQRVLCLGLRELAIEKYGLLAPVVLEHWRVRRTFDFGRIVFAMIDAGLMTKTHRDSLEDFQAVYDFEEAFSHDALLAHIGRN